MKVEQADDKCPQCGWEKHPPCDGCGTREGVTFHLMGGGRVTPVCPACLEKATERTKAYWENYEREAAEARAAALQNRSTLAVIGGAMLAVIRGSWRLARSGHEPRGAA